MNTRKLPPRPPRNDDIQHSTRHFEDGNSHLLEVRTAKAFLLKDLLPFEPLKQVSEKFTHECCAVCPNFECGTITSKGSTRADCVNSKLNPESIVYVWGLEADDYTVTQFPSLKTNIIFCKKEINFEIWKEWMTFMFDTKGFDPSSLFDPAESRRLKRASVRKTKNSPYRSRLNRSKVSPRIVHLKTGRNITIPSGGMRPKIVRGKSGHILYQLAEPDDLKANDT